MRNLLFLTLCSFVFMVPQYAQAISPLAVLADEDDGNGDGDQKADAYSIADAYAYATTSVQTNGAVFFELSNINAQDDRIVSAHADVSEKVELHTHEMDGGIMMMREVEAYELPAGQGLSLEPMGYHIMLIGLKAPLKAGESFPLTLDFEKHQSITFKVQIKNPGDVH